MQSGVPIPRIKQTKPRLVYPWLTLNVGDSFLYLGQRKAASAVASKAGVRHGRKFVTRFTNEGVRIWRVR